MAHAQSKSSKLVALVKCSLHQTAVPQERIYGQEQVAQYYPKLLVGHMYPLSPPVAGSFLQFSVWRKGCECPSHSYGIGDPKFRTLYMVLLSGRLGKQKGLMKLAHMT